MGFFIMIWNQNATHLIPLMNDDDITVMLFDSIEQAKGKVENDDWAQDNGYMIFATGDCADSN